MSCDLSNIIVHFIESGIKVRPLSLDIRKSRRTDNDFDHVQATLKKISGQHVRDNNIHKEPVEIIGDKEGNNIYRGYYKTDGVTVAENEAILKINDPRKILQEGTIDKEWGRISLKNVVDYIFKRRNDPHNVLHSFKLAESSLDTTKLQHTDDLASGAGNERTPETTSKLSDAFVDFRADISPFGDGDGNFDFREESPYSALAEVANIWETQFWVDQDGTLVIGHPDVTATVYGAGQGPDNWHISEWNLPKNPTPLKGVVVKGKMDQKGGKDNALEELWNVVTNKKKFQTRAAAGFLDDESLEETIVLDGKKNTTDPKVLKRMARSAFMEHHTKQNRGSVTINTMVENKIPQSQYAGVDIGDKLLVNNFQADCNKLQSGVYDIHEIQHDITGSDGWTITLDVSQAITNSDAVKSRFWYFDPTDSDMNQDSPFIGLQV